MSETTKPCPFCAETIQAAAVVCRYCGRDLVEKKVPPHRVQAGAAWQCSECQGFIRADAIQCKHCHAVFGVETAERPAAFVPPPAKKTNSTAVVLALVVAAVVGAVFLYGGGGSNRPAPRTATTHNITYRVKGTTGSADLTYQNAQGGTEQINIKPPWESKFSARPGAFLYLSAQNQWDAGTIICEILVDGTVVKTSTSDGGYKIASCSGRL